MNRSPKPGGEGSQDSAWLKDSEDSDSAFDLEVLSQENNLGAFMHKFQHLQDRAGLLISLKSIWETENIFIKEPGYSVILRIHKGSSYIRVQQML